MSSSAALAAAKKRRNPGSMEQSNSQRASMKSEIAQPRAPTNVNQLIVQHDARLFILEKQLSSSRDEYALKRDVELLQLTNSTQNLGITSNIDNAVTNKLEKQVKEIAALNATVGKLTKSVTDANIIITTLKASILTQSNDIQELKALKSQSIDLNKLKLDFDNFVKSIKPADVQ